MSEEVHYLPKVYPTKLLSVLHADYRYLAYANSATAGKDLYALTFEVQVTEVFLVSAHRWSSVQNAWHSGWVETSHRQRKSDIPWEGCVESVKEEHQLVRALAQDLRFGPLGLLAECEINSIRWAKRAYEAQLRQALNEGTEAQRMEAVAKIKEPDGLEDHPHLDALEYLLPDLYDAYREVVDQGKTLTDVGRKMLGR